MSDEYASPEMTLILGVGNIIMGDEGFGVHVARRLKECELPDNVKIEEGGVGGFNLLGSLDGIRRLIVVDVMMTDGSPGEVYLFKPDDVREPGKQLLSFHHVGVMELVQMWGLLGYQPEIFFLVTRPEKMEWSMELSPVVQGAADKAVELIRGFYSADFTGLERSLGICT